MKLEFAGQIFDKSKNIRFYKNPSVWCRDVQRRRTEGHTHTHTHTHNEANSHISEFWDKA